LLIREGADCMLRNRTKGSAKEKTGNRIEGVGHASSVSRR
jgi:hypothetical protein